MSSEERRENSKEEKKEWPPYNPFVRQPTTFQAKVLMVVFGIILVPIRIVGSLTTMILAYLWVNLCIIGVKDFSTPYTPTRTLFLHGGTRIFARLLLFFYGFVWIQSTTVEEENTKQKKQKQQRHHQQQSSTTKPLPSTIIVVNHIGFAELIYLHYFYGCCFVSKESNRKLPFMGPITVGLQSIFVNRMKRLNSQGSSDDDKIKGTESKSTTLKSKSTTEQILERARTSTSGTSAASWPPLLVCPEGTTTNGHCMIQFSTGAFLAGIPIQPVVVQSKFSPKYGYDPSFTCTNIVLHIIGLMTQPINQLHVQHLPIYVPSQEEQNNAKLYATNVRTVMSKQLDVQVYNLTYSDKLEYEQHEKELRKQKKVSTSSGGQQQQEQLQPPTPSSSLPVFTHDPFGNRLKMAEESKIGKRKKDN